jgi:hypothetical protein
MRMLPLLLSGALLLAAVSASAQGVMSRFDQLPREVEPGDTIIVTDQSGATLKGTLATLSPSTLELRVPAYPLPVSRRLLDRDIATIVRCNRDAVWNGMLIGFAAGAAPVGVAFLYSGEPWHRDYAAPILGVGAAGLVTGLLIDLLHTERVTVYVSGPRAGVSLKF